MLICSLILLLRKRLRKKRFTYQIPLRMTLNNLIATDKKSHMKRTISLCHCRGHDYIMLVFCFEGFYDSHVRLLSKSYYYK